MPSLALLLDVLARTESVLRSLAFKLTEVCLLLAAGRASMAVRAADEVDVLHDQLGALEIEREVRTADLAATLGLTGQVSGSQLVEHLPRAFRPPLVLQLSALRTCSEEVERLSAQARTHASTGHSTLTDALTQMGA
jgi:hypothetical protein